MSMCHFDLFHLDAEFLSERSGLHCRCRIQRAHLSLQRLWNRSELVAAGLSLPDLLRFPPSFATADDGASRTSCGVFDMSLVTAVYHQDRCARRR